MLVRQKGSRFRFLIATSSIEQHGYEQCAGHPPTPAPGPLGHPASDDLGEEEAISRDAIGATNRRGWPPLTRDPEGRFRGKPASLGDRNSGLPIQASG